MAVTAEQVQLHVNASGSDVSLLPALLSRAIVMVDEFLGFDGRETCPQEVKDEAVIELVSELWDRRNSPGGNMQWGPDGTVAYMNSDPMQSVKPMLRKYRGLGAVG